MVLTFVLIFFAFVRLLYISSLGFDIVSLCALHFYTVLPETQIPKTSHLLLPFRLGLGLHEFIICTVAMSRLTLKYSYMWTVFFKRTTKKIMSCSYCCYVYFSLPDIQKLILWISNMLRSHSNINNRPYQYMVEDFWIIS